MNQLELFEELRKVDEITLLELLEINSDDILDAFADRCYENYSKLLKWVYDN